MMKTCLAVLVVWLLTLPLSPALRAKAGRPTGPKKRATVKKTKQPSSGPLYKANGDVFYGNARAYKAAGGELHRSAAKSSSSSSRSRSSPSSSSSSTTTWTKSFYGGAYKAAGGKPPRAAAAKSSCSSTSTKSQAERALRKAANAPAAAAYTYVLKLKNGKEYVGMTTDLVSRMGAHFAGKGAQATQKHAPTSISKITPCRSAAEAQKKEQSQLESRSKDLGPHNVRGGDRCDSTDF
jgi:predicted GIY-YIG superfamily endonuclease